MTVDGVKHALAFVTSAYSSYSGCRQYREDIQRAQAAVGPDAPQISVLRKFYNHPGFIQPNVEHIRAAFDQIPEVRRAAAKLVFTAHSIPKGMAQNSDYEAQLKDTCQLVANELGRQEWELVYQSRSGAPGQAWLEPDINDTIRRLKAEGVTDVVVSPIGFISDHMEVLFDLDTEARQLADDIGIHIIRAATAGAHPAFISMIRELILERTTTTQEKRFMGTRGANHDICPADCCLAGVGRPVAAKVTTET